MSKIYQPKIIRLCDWSFETKICYQSHVTNHSQSLIVIGWWRPLRFDLNKILENQISCVIKLIRSNTSLERDAFLIHEFRLLPRLCYMTKKNVNDQFLKEDGRQKQEVASPN